MNRTTLASSTATLTVAALLVMVCRATLHAGGALAAEPPQPKEGLWSIHSQDVDIPSNKKTEVTSTLCRSHASDLHTREDATRMRNCVTVSEKRQANQYTLASRCRIKGSIVRSRSTTVFRADVIHTEVHITYTPALNGITGSTLVEDQKYLGKCPAGAEPGDMLLPDGTVQHLGRPHDTTHSHPK